MPQYILLQSYLGLSDYVYIAKCSGRRLDLPEVKQLELTDDQALRRHERSSYTQEWFEIHPGDWIEVEIIGEDYGEKNLHVRFTIPEKGLENPPQKLDTEYSHNRLHEYLLTQCSIEVLPESLDNI